MFTHSLHADFMRYQGIGETKFKANESVKNSDKSEIKIFESKNSNRSLFGNIPNIVLYVIICIVLYVMNY